MKFMISGAASINTTTEQVRSGTYAFKHVVSGSDKRAEIDDNSWNAYPKSTYYYGMSYWIPTNWESDYQAILAQWRYSNLIVSPYTVPNCTSYKTVSCNNPVLDGGSGWMLQAFNGNWKLSIRSAEPGCATCKGMNTRDVDLGAIIKGQWTDWVFKINYSPDTNGSIDVWKATNRGPYSLVYSWKGRTWFGKYADGSQLAGREVNAGNFTVGHYYSNKSNSHYLYTDEIRVSNNPTGGFNEVKVP
jgi:hypothetical protein